MSYDASKLDVIRAKIKIKIERMYVEAKYSSVKDKFFWLVLVPLLFVAIFVFKVGFVSGSSMMPTYDGTEVLGVNMLVKQVDVGYGDRLGFDCSAAKLNRSNCVKRVIGKPTDRVMIKDSVVYVNGQPLKRRELTGEEVRVLLANKAIGKFYSVLSPVVGLTMYEETLPNGETYTVQVATRPEGYLPLIVQAKALNDEVYKGISTNYKGVLASINMEEVTLKENEYFMMGDNRGFSADSVDFGSVHWNLVKGRVVDLGIRLPW